ncbi:hypothetical protein LTR16_003175 [Cryomyces antarcticus]|uniref:UDP-glucose 6-dehydrogenase n=1 Tax=Cryomyces antarcticus TaxID=329879 RepID=A0ABR0LYB9_9PEZI|nr:hypothetical protein LTR16_003175 [Cryomyces antarcticus]
MEGPSSENDASALLIDFSFTPPQTPQRKIQQYVEPAIKEATKRQNGLGVEHELQCCMGAPDEEFCTSTNINTPTLTPFKRICIVGAGYVGAPTGAVIAYETDFDVTVVDYNAQRIAAWNSADLPIYESGLDHIVNSTRDGISKHADGVTTRSNLVFTTDVEGSIDAADIIFIAVNTPTKTQGQGKGYAADLRFVEEVTRTIAKVAKADKIVVEKSTVPVKTAESVRLILMANAQPGVRFEVLSNPEYLAEGQAVADMLDPDRIIIGSLPTPEGLKAADALVEVYSQWVKRSKIITINLWSSELARLAANAMLAQRISNVNALSAICEKTGASVDEVAYACGLDHRIGNGMLKAGPGFGGSCFRKDILSLVYLSETLGLPEVANYWRGVVDINEYQKDRFTKRVISCRFNTLTNKKIAVLGFTFKKNTADIRESPAITMVTNFLSEGAQVAVYDPRARKQQILVDLHQACDDTVALENNLMICGNAYHACDGADAVIVLTEWDEFSNVDLPTLEVQTADPVALKRSTVLDPNANNFVPEGTRHKEEELCAVSAFLGALEARNVKVESPRITSDDEGSEGSSVRVPITPAQTVPQWRIDWVRIARGMRKPMFVFDGRNILDHGKLQRLGFRVEAIGKASLAEANVGC